MKQENVAKINLEVRKCQDCPFVRKQKGYAGWFCTHDLHTPGIEVNENMVPSWCPFVVGRLQKVLGIMEDVSEASIPKKWIRQIERKQKDHPDPKFGADHAWKHIENVTSYGEDFLEYCVGYGIVSNNEVMRLKLLLRIAAMLHDVGLAETNEGYAIHSAGMARKYLSSKKIDIEERDIDLICHAISDHSYGQDTKNLLDAALLLGDKLDVTRDRMIRKTKPIIEELMKVEKVEYRFLGKLFVPTGAELRYFTNGDFDVSVLKSWPKAITIPRKVTLEFLGLSSFKFLVDGKEVNI